MKEVTCPKCNNTQKLGSANICGYCYYKFDEPNKLVVNLAPVESNLSDTQIIEVLDLMKDSYKQDSSKFFFQAGVFFVISFLLFFIDFKLFPISLSEAYFLGISFFATFFTTYLTYKYLGEFFDLSEISATLFYRGRFGKEPTKFEQFIYLVFCLFALNFFFDYFSLYAINDFSSMVFPAHIHEVFISKETQRVKGGYTYYLNVTNWKRTKDPNLKLKTSQAEWDKYQDQKSAKIRVKSGLIEDVVWHIEQ